MEVLQIETWQQLGAAGLLFLVLIWQIIERDKVIKVKDEQIEAWQNKAFDAVSTSQKVLYESTTTFDKVLDALKG